MVELEVSSFPYWPTQEQLRRTRRLWGTNKIWGEKRGADGTYR